MYIKAITTEEEFDKIKDEWLVLEEKVNNKSLTISYHFQRIWWKHFSKVNNKEFGFDKKLCILLLYNNKDNLRAIAPFCEVKRKAMKIFSYNSIEFIGQQFGADYLDLLSKDLTSEEKNYIFNWLRENRKYDLITLQYISNYTKNFDLKSNNVTILSVCPEINGENYFNIRKEYYSKNLKHKLNRIRNKMKRESKIIKVKIVKGENILQYFSNIEEISGSKKLSAKKNIYDEIWKRKYVLNILEELSPYSKCIFLLYNNKICAYNWGLRYNNKYYAMDASYSREIKELENYSLGNIIYDEVIKYTLSNGITNFCFGTGSESYKFRFTKNIIKVFNYFEVGNTLKARYVYKRKLQLSKKEESRFLEEIKEILPDFKK